MLKSKSLMYSEPMKTLSVLVIWESGMFIALAFSRSMVTSTCGIVGRELGEQAGEILARIARAHHLVGDAVQIAEGVGARSCSMNWKPPKLPTPFTAGG